ncbi:hypothetical protein [Streptomyces sp. NPDC051921]|uniref:hypothetical protein n=1 Tax=Streptomyces sp. NPDC051921 TaxID=3155806 RepID=UPI003423FD7A
MTTTRTLPNELAPEARGRPLEYSHPVRLPAEDLSVGEAVFVGVAATMARRLLSVRSRLLDDLVPRVGAEDLAYAR